MVCCHPSSADRSTRETMKRGGGSLAEQALILDGKAPELPKAVERPDGGH